MKELARLILIPRNANNLADLYLEHDGDANVALSLAQMAKRKMPDFPNAAHTLGWAYYKLGSPEVPPWMEFRNAHIKARGINAR